MKYTIEERLEIMTLLDRLDNLLKGDRMAVLVQDIRDGVEESTDSNDD